MIGGECKKVSMNNENIPKRQAKNDNKLKECVSLRKEDYIKSQEESVLNSMNDKKKPKPYNKGWSN